MNERDWKIIAVNDRQTIYLHNGVKHIVPGGNVIESGINDQGNSFVVQQTGDSTVTTMTLRPEIQARMPNTNSRKTVVQCMITFRDKFFSI